MRGNDHYAKPDRSQFGTVLLAGSAGPFKLVADHPRFHAAILPDTAEAENAAAGDKNAYSKLNRKQREKVIRNLEKEMREAARLLEFEKAAEARDLIMELKAMGNYTL